MNTERDYWKELHKGLERAIQQGFDEARERQRAEAREKNPPRDEPFREAR